MHTVQRKISGDFEAPPIVVERVPRSREYIQITRADRVSNAAERREQGKGGSRNGICISSGRRGEKKTFFIYWETGEDTVSRVYSHFVVEKKTY